MSTFNPDLIIEVTSACNQSCKGCYAPNVVSTKEAIEIMEEKPDLFLKLEMLDQTIMNWEHPLPRTISLRGGEPSLHPHLNKIIEALKFFANERIIETHGRWLLEKNRNSYKEAVEVLKSEKVTVKISFDSMHRLSPSDLNEITSYLDSINCNYLIAITENTEEEFLSSVKLIPWVDRSKVISQKKATKRNELITSTYGVLNVSGVLKSELNSKLENQIRVAVG